ncbi:hypothetical protein JCM10908_004190 [Rhodotorula pacifica]|uniref:uncharacterized protein n=1 Tax=Rhodotorula pacifica TaxID=1495444 RepID=UPI00316FAF48
MDAGGPAGLGISFDTHSQHYEHYEPVHVHEQHHRHHVQYDYKQPRLPHHLPHLRPLRESMSYDAGLRERAQAQAAAQQQQQHYAPYPHDVYQKHVRIANGTPEVLNGRGGYLPYDADHLSPLSDFDHSAPSDSASGSSRPFSPASMSSLPSSTDSGAHPAYAAQQQMPPHPEYPIQHHHEQQRGHYGPSYPISYDQRQGTYEQALLSQQEPSARPSRLPAFLAERKELGRPHSMVDLRQSQKAREAEQAHYHEVPQLQPRAQIEYADSPIESVPSSAAALQRERFEAADAGGNPAQQEHRPMRQSEGRPRRRRNSDEETSPLRNRSRSLPAFELRMLAESEAARSTTDSREDLTTEVIDEESGQVDSPQLVDDSGTVISIAPPIEAATKASVKRQPMLLTAGASTVRRRKELDRLLMPSTRFGAFGEGPTPAYRNSGAADSSATSSPAVLEQAKSASNARVELDLMLETPLVVEGGWLKGKLEVRARKPGDREGELWLGKPKLRVIGFEELASGEGRFIFFHHASSVDSLDTPSGQACSLPCFDSAADEEGFHRAKLGQHTMPVKMLIPVGKGAKGPWKGKQGVVRYIAIVSVKLKSAKGADRSIAHFYRHLEVFPYIHPALALAPASKPIVDEASKALFMGGSGQATIRASVHREIWIAGQRCYVEVAVENRTNKKIKTLTLSLVRTTSIYRSTGRTVQGVTETQLVQSTKKKVAESTLELGKKSSSGATAKGAWVGVEAGASASFSPTLVIPPDALTLQRGRHVEVIYHLRVTISASLSADVSVELPLEIVNFVSLDPPPGHIGVTPVLSNAQRPVARSWSSTDLRQAVRTGTTARQPNRMTSMDSLRLEDLEGMRPMSCQKAPALSRVASLESIHTLDLPRAEPVEHLDYTDDEQERALQQPDPVRQQPSQQSVIVDRARERQLRHQMSLQCISSAIASATARRNSPQASPNRSPAGVSENGPITNEPSREFSSALYTLPPVDISSSHGGLGIQLDDLDDVPDEVGLDRLSGQHRRHESLIADEELAMIMQSQFSDDDEDVPPSTHSRQMMHPVRSPPQAVEVRVTPPTPSGRFAQAEVNRSESPVRTVNAPRASSPLKGRSPETARPLSPTKRSTQTPEKFGFATPSSPIKASPEKAAQSPRVRVPLAATRAARPLPTPPPAPAASASPTKSATAPLPGAMSLRKVPSGTSLKRSPGMLRKASSIQSLRSGGGSSPSAGSDSSRTLARSPSSLSSPQVSPVLASGTNAAATFSTSARPTLSPTLEEAAEPPRRVVAPVSPALRATRSMMDMRHQSAPTTSLSPRKSTILPSVKVKAAALESRQAALTGLATQTGNTTGRARVKDAAAQLQLSRADSIASSIAPSEFNLKRADSMASFKAPLLRRGFEEMPPPVPALPRARS